MSSRRKRISKEDHISGLPHDCILNVFGRLDHNDLDELAILNGRLANLAELSRNKAAKVVATELTVSRTSPRCCTHFEYNFVLHYANEVFYFTFRNTASSLSRKMSRFVEAYPHCYVIEPEQNVIATRVFTERAATILGRFHFEICTFKSLCIDKYVLEYLEKITCAGSFTSFELSGCTIDYLDNQGKARYLYTFDERFLRDYAKYFPQSEFRISDPKAAMLRPGNDFAPYISGYGTLVLPHLLATTDWLVYSIMDRLRHRLRGLWKFRITRPMNQVEMENAAGGEMQYLSLGAGIHEVKIPWTKFDVRIALTRPAHNNWIEMEATF